jgi:membrane protein DedA with SNARE-associated domain
MIDLILAFLSRFVEYLIDTFGYWGVFGGMVVESANIPLPSEVIMPLGGLAAAQGTLNIWLVILAGTMGNVTGSLISYAIGYYGGRPFIDRYGKYIFFTHEDMDKAEKWFGKYGHEAVFISRVLPVVRTFISLPAGIARMSLTKFIIYTFIGSFIWCTIWAYIGFILGKNWETLHHQLRWLDYLVAAAILALIIYWVAKKIKEKRAAK